MHQYSSPAATFFSSLKSLFCLSPSTPRHSSPAPLRARYASQIANPPPHSLQRSPSQHHLNCSCEQPHPLEPSYIPAFEPPIRRNEKRIKLEVMTRELMIPSSTYTAFASGPDGKTFVEKHLELPALGRNDVAIAILCCSVCFTDTMYAAQLEGSVVGHEIIGRVEFKGESVTNVNMGDIVGFGYIRSTCLECQYCLQGQENMCPKRTTFSDGVGGFANASVWDSRFVYKIPETIEPRHAGPLTCAGATVFAALYGYNVSPTSTVGIVGMGGLGHLAIKFAKAWGCKVVAISSSRDKEHDARAFGAHEFVCTQDPIATSTKMDYILNTVSGDLPWETFINLLETNGTLINMGVSAKGSMEIPYFPHLFKQLKVVGSLVASRHVVKKMLDFAALHNIKPEIEELDMDVKGCREAFRRVTEQRARYRVVLNVPPRLAL